MEEAPELELDFKLQNGNTFLIRLLWSNDEKPFI